MRIMSQEKPQQQESTVHEMQKDSDNSEYVMCYEPKLSIFTV